MKICIYADNHWSQYSSIVRQRGEKYSLRLENQIVSINGAEALAKSQGCDMIVHLGDFFDAPNLNSEEITALKELRWATDIPHYFIVGNHEIGTKSLEFNSLNVLTSNSPFKLIDKIERLFRIEENLELIFLPYQFEEDRNPLSEELGGWGNFKRIIFSHNDIKGIQMGEFVSQSGYKISDIEANCDLFINGHIHNGGKISDKIINCGNLTGQNFGEDAMKYEHTILVLDTDTMRVAVFENPYAFNFYKLDFYTNNDIDYINSCQLKPHAVCSIRCAEKDLHYLKVRFGNEKDDLIPKNCNVIASRFIVVPNISKDTETKVAELSDVDHLQMFRTFVLNELGGGEVVLQELEEVCK